MEDVQNTGKGVSKGGVGNNLKLRLAISPRIWYNKSIGYAAKCNAEFVKKQRKGERD